MTWGAASRDDLRLVANWEALTTFKRLRDIYKSADFIFIFANIENFSSRDRFFESFVSTQEMSKFKNVSDNNKFGSISTKCQLWR